MPLHLQILLLSLLELGEIAGQTSFLWVHVLWTRSSTMMLRVALQSYSFSLGMGMATCPRVGVVP